MGGQTEKDSKTSHQVQETVPALFHILCLSFWDTDFNSVETHYEVKGRRFHRSVKCVKSERKTLSCVFADVLTFTCESDGGRFTSRTKHCLAWKKRGVRWHFQHKHMIMC